MTVRKAVIPAAGLGTRFLPATKSLPKEMIPLVDKPAIQYVVEEAVRAGIEDILIITSRGKVSLEDHFDRSPELEEHLERAGKLNELDEVRAIGDLAEITFIRQKEPLGFGHAVSLARTHVGDEPFVVLVGDEIVPEPIAGETDLVPRMVGVRASQGGHVVAVQEVAEEDIPGYGIVAIKEQDGEVRRVTDMIEKPAIHDAPSNLGSRGRYVFGPELFDALERTPRGVGGEIQLTDAIKLLATEGDVYAYIHDGPIYDAGKKLDYLKTTIELALRREDLGKSFRDYLTERLRALD